MARCRSPFLADRNPRSSACPVQVSGPCAVTVSVPTGHRIDRAGGPLFEEREGNGWTYWLPIERWAATCKVPKIWYVAVDRGFSDWARQLSGTH